MSQQKSDSTEDRYRQLFLRAKGSHASLGEGSILQIPLYYKTWKPKARQIHNHIYSLGIWQHRESQPDLNTYISENADTISEKKKKSTERLGKSAAKVQTLKDILSIKGDNDVLSQMSIRAITKLILLYRISLVKLIYQ